MLLQLNNKTDQRKSVYVKLFVSQILNVISFNKFTKTDSPTVLCVHDTTGQIDFDGILEYVKNC